MSVSLNSSLLPTPYLNLTSAVNTTELVKTSYTSVTTTPFYSIAELFFIYLAGFLLSIVTIGGNVLVVIAYWTNPRINKSVTNLFIFSLSISDITVGVVSINLYTIYVAKKEWLLGVVVCDIWLCLDYACCQASVIHLIVICIDRYFSVTKPLSYRAKRTRFRAIVVILLAWFLAFFQWAPWIVSYPFMVGRTVPENACYVQFLPENWYISIITSIAAYYVPVLIMLVVYLRIYFLMKEREKAFNKLTKGPKSSKSNLEILNSYNTIDVSMTGSPRIGNKNSVAVCDTVNAMGKAQLSKLTNVLKQRKCARMLSIVFATFTITWCPYYILTLISPFCKSCIPTALWDFSYMFCYINSTVNPFCYSLGNREFRVAFKKLLCPTRRISSMQNEPKLAVAKKSKSKSIVQKLCKTDEFEESE